MSEPQEAKETFNPELIEKLAFSQLSDGGHPVTFDVLNWGTEKNRCTFGRTFAELVQRPEWELFMDMLLSIQRRAAMDKLNAKAGDCESAHRADCRIELIQELRYLVYSMVDESQQVSSDEEQTDG